MRKLWVMLLVGTLLLSFAAGAWAAPTVEDLSNQVKQLQDALKQALDRIQKLEAQKAAPPPVQPAAQPAAAPPSRWYDKITVSGYTHARYEDRRMTMPAASPPAAFNPDSATRARDEFLIRRMYLNFISKPNDRTTAVVSLRRLGTKDQNIDLEALFVNYVLSDLWSVEFGRVYNRFGWDAFESSSKRLPFDRFPGVEGYGAAGLRGLYCNGPTDQGVYFIRKSAGDWEPTAYFGLVNGNFISPDNNANKTVSLDLKWRRDVVDFGVSYIGGEFTETVGTSPMTTDREMFGFFVHTDPSPWSLQGEWIIGRLFGQEVTGFYGQIARKVGQGTPYIRFEQYNPSKDIFGDLYNAWKFGYAYQMDKNNELTLEYLYAERDTVDVGQFGLQWQFSL
ncbi:OprO/OprP family phosphate-selective porin [bacterium]|nr:OprO/OprP family phosphate-selective porin [bacterium]